ncbi:DNA polymerase III subunit delta' [uncultured Litoreibacter sp.]|uniref:DNA polymerase III subunit delta' n=1 Tax=uncultured Litoreibacter sp. TaxID=1392394 RepID=UPI0026294AC2|nr:DNA polymerase III subunit delta' [uncultured Litoreibacter sp.]
MSDIDDIPQPDQIDGAPHPRETARLIGQAPAEATFLDAFNGDRLHHAWLITGPKGVGKATLAWRLAKFLIATPKDDAGMFAAPAPETLDISEDHPVTSRIAALSEPGLFLLRRGWDEKTKKLKSVITVDEVRKLKGFFSMSNPDGGKRVVIVDAADEMNVSAANALLKVLEEPPADCILLLISHQPSRLLPTIRSRCRELRCQQLNADDMAVALNAAGADANQHAVALSELSGGSVGEALRLLNLDGLTLYKELMSVIDTFPRLDRARAIALGEKAAARNVDGRLDLMLRLFDVALSRLSRAGLGMVENQAASGELLTLARLSPNEDAARRWATLSASSSARARHGQAVNLDPSSLILDMVLTMNEVAGKTAA